MTTATTQSTMNGVDVDRLHRTVEHIEESPDLARFTFRATTAWQGGARVRTEIQDFYGAGEENDSRDEPFVLEGDEPPILLGENRGPNAVEALLHALTSCLAVGFVYNAAAKGIEVESLDMEVAGDLDLRSFLGMVDPDTIRPGYEGIEVRYAIEADAPHEQLVELCDYVQTTSPVLDMLRNPVPVTVGLKS